MNKSILMCLSLVCALPLCAQTKSEVKLEEKEYLYVCVEQEDIRRKKVLPTEKLMQEGAVFVEQARQMEAQICGALDAEEKREFWRLSRKILTRFSEMDCIRTHKMTEQEVSVL